LRNANLGRDNLDGSTQLQGANLVGTNLQGTKLEGAEYDTNTVFPDGFDPVKNGLLFKEKSSTPDQRRNPKSEYHSDQAIAFQIARRSRSGV